MRSSSLKVLVTGGTGFLGGKTINLIQENGHEVVALVRSTSNTEGLPKNVEIREADLFDFASLKVALKDVDAVIHFAAYFDFYPRDEELMFKVNVEGTKNLMNACVGTKVQRFIYCSSTETMGQST